MEKKRVFTLALFSIILSLVFLSGCGSDEDKTTGATVKTPVCNSPYFEFKVGECCLDSNNNSICDTDDGILAEKTAVKEVVVEEKKEVEITLEDSCTDTTYLECKASYLTKDEIFLKLGVLRDGYLHLNKISALGCEKIFPDRSKVIDGYQLRTEIVASIPCQKLIVGDKVENAEYILEYIYYPKGGFINPETGQWEGAARALQRSSGQISGTVRSEPRVII